MVDEIERASDVFIIKFVGKSTFRKCLIFEYQPQRDQRKAARSTQRTPQKINQFEHLFKTILSNE